jgi:ribosome-binding factor A
MVLRYTKPPSVRQLKIAEQIRQSIAEVLIRGELNHPFFDKVLITVSEVRISPDLKMATAFLIFDEKLDVKAIIKLFNDISPRIRKLITSKIDVRFSPQIKFVYDDSAKNAFEIESIFKKIEE